MIVFGNEKGGTGKSTLAMHVLVCLLGKGCKVGVIDLDIRQRSVSRYLENRAAFISRSRVALPMPQSISLEDCSPTNVGERSAHDQRIFQSALDELRGKVEFIVIDCPGSYSYLSQLAHALADTLVTPMNDSFVDMDLLAQVEPESYQVAKLSHYAEMVWNGRKFRSASELPPMDWVVTPNRVATLSSRNNVRVDAALNALQKRLMFRHVPGLSERVIYRELFPKGLTMMDIREIPGMGLTQVSHVAARYEVRELVQSLNLPEKASVAAEKA